MTSPGSMASLGVRPSAPAPVTTAVPTWQQDAGSMLTGATGRAPQTGGLAQGGAAMSWGDPNVRSQVPQTQAPHYTPGFGETYGQQHIGQYDTPTALETFAQQQLNGNNPYYDRLRQQGEAGLNQQMAARGHYNSGGALSALGNFDSGLYAQQFNDMGNLLNSAGSMQLNRQQAGQNTANNIQQLNQAGTGQMLQYGSDIAHLQSGLVGGFYGQGGQLSGDAAMAGINAGANASQLQGQGENALPNAGLSVLNGYFSSRK